MSDSGALPKAEMTFSLPELEFLRQLVDFRRQEPHWHPTYLAILNAVGPRIEAEIEKIETPYREAEILRQADEIRARRQQQLRLET